MFLWLIKKIRTFQFFYNKKLKDILITNKLDSKVSIHKGIINDINLNENDIDVIICPWYG